MLDLKLNYYIFEVRSSTAMRVIGARSMLIVILMILFDASLNGKPYCRTCSCMQTLVVVGKLFYDVMHDHVYTT